MSMSERHTESGVERRLQEIRARLEAATPGPWEVEAQDDAHVIRMASAITSPANHDVQDSIVYDHGLYADVDTDAPQRALADANAALIAHAPEDIAFLLDALDASDKCKGQLRRELAAELQKGAALSAEAAPEPAIYKSPPEVNSAQAIQDALEEALDSHWGKAYLLRDHDERYNVATLEDAWYSTVAGLSGRVYAALTRRGLALRASRGAGDRETAPTFDPRPMGRQLADDIREILDVAAPRFEYMGDELVKRGWRRVDFGEAGTVEGPWRVERYAGSVGVEARDKKGKSYYVEFRSFGNRDLPERDLTEAEAIAVCAALNRVAVGDGTP